MPGGRLTHQDRRHIARGLAEGLTYTEIARSLQRPISTITREVARNGGAGGYRADQAQQATAGRARRRRPISSSGPPATDAPGRDPHAVRDLEEQFTGAMTEAGLSRMTARVLTCMYTADSGSLTAAELVQHLQVSPASISKAVGELEQQGLIRRDRDPRRRRDRYVIDADAWVQGWIVSARRNVTMADLARKGAEIVGATTPAGARLKDVSEFFDHVGRHMIQAAEHWRQTSMSRRTISR